MFEAVPQELKQEAEKVLRRASREVYKVLDEAENLIDQASRQLEAWADALNTDPAGTEQATKQQKIDYLLAHADDFEKQMYENVDWAGTADEVLDAVYASVVRRENAQPDDAHCFDDEGKD